MWLFVWDSEPSKIFVGDTPISKVFLWDTQVRPSGWWGWQPWANTLAYRPLSSDLDDYSWNNHHFSAGWGSYSFSNNMCTLQRASVSGFSLGNYSWDFTLSMRTTSAWPNCAFMPVINSSGYPSLQIYWIWTEIGFNMVLNNDWYWVYYNPYHWIWIHLLTWTKTGTQITLYIDWQEHNHITGTYGQLGADNNTWLWRNVNGSWTLTAGNVIIENKARTSQEVVDYYNLTKWNYWL